MELHCCSLSGKNKEELLCYQLLDALYLTFLSNFCLSSLYKIIG